MLKSRNAPSSVVKGLLRGARHLAVFSVLLLPFSIYLGPLNPVTLFFCYCHLCADARAAFKRTPWYVRWPGKLARPMRFCVSVYALALLFMFLPVLKDYSAALFLFAVALAALSAKRKYRLAYIPAHAATLIAAMSLWLSIGPLGDQARQKKQPPWLEPVLVRRAAEPRCRVEYPNDDIEYSIRNVTFEADESALYAAFITRDRDKYVGLTVIKKGLKPGMKDACWADGFCLHASTDPATRRAFISQRKDNVVRVLDAGGFKLLDNWRAFNLRTKQPFKIQQTLPQPEKGLLWVLNEGADDNVALDLKTGERRFAVRDPAFHIEYVYDGKNTVYSSNVGLRIVSKIPLDGKTPPKRGRLGAGSWSVFYDAKDNDVYVTDFFLGMVYRLDAATLETEWSCRLTPGERPVLADQNRRVLYVGNVMTGRLTMFNMDNLGERYSVLAGSGIQQLTQAPVSKRIYIGTKAGLFRLNEAKLPGMFGSRAGGR